VPRRAPRAIRRTGHDPRAELRLTVSEQWDRLAESSQARAVLAGRPPISIVAAGSLDGAVASPARIDVLAPDELTAAAERAHIDLAAASTADEPALQGFVSALRGTAGELHTLEALADGALPAPVGTASAELVTHTHPGVDLVFRDARGHVLDTANVKIAANPDIALRHFGRHDDVRLVYAPSDTADRLERMGLEVVRAGEPVPTDGNVIIDLGTPTGLFDTQVRDALAGTVADATTPLWQLVPWFGFAAVGIRAVGRLSTGADHTVVRQHAMGDAAVAATASAVSKAAVIGTGSAFAAVPFALVGAWAAQALVATRRSWRQATAQQRQLRERLGELPDGT
jgi:hypothetical protein